MKLPHWVREAIEEFVAPTTGKVEIVLEIYMGGVSKMELGGSIRLKPEGSSTSERSVSPHGKLQSNR